MANTPHDPPGWPFDQGNQPNLGASGPPAARLPPSSTPPPPIPNRGAVPPPPPRAPMPPPPPRGRRSSRTVWIVLLCVFVALVLSIGACTVWFLGAIRPPVDRSNEFLALIDDTDYLRAMSLVDPGCGRGINADVLDQVFAGRDIDYDLNSSNVSTVNGNTTAAVAGRITIGGVDERITVFLSEIADEWFVCGFNLSSN